MLVCEQDDETGDILTTNHRGMFIRVEHTKGLHV